MLGVIEMQGRWPGATALAEPSAHPRAADFLQPLHPDEEGGREEPEPDGSPAGSFGSDKVWPAQQVFHSNALFGSSNNFGPMTHFKEGTHFEDGNTFEDGASFGTDAHFGVRTLDLRACTAMLLPRHYPLRYGSVHLVSSSPSEARAQANNHFGKDATVGKGSTIGAGAMFGEGAVIGQRSVFGASSHGVCKVSTACSSIWWILECR